MKFGMVIAVPMLLLAGPVAAETATATTGFDDPVLTINGPIGGYSNIPSERLFKRATPPLDARLSKADKLRSTLPVYAGCLINLHSAGTKIMFDMIPGTPEYVAAAEKVVDKDCLAKGQISFRPSELHWAFFTHKYRDEFGNHMPAISDKPFDFAALAAKSSGDAASIYVAIRRFGECAVRKDPVLAREYVLSAVASDKEAELIGKISPNLNACLLEGSTFGISKASLTGIFAEALYRISLTKAEEAKGSAQ